MVEVECVIAGRLLAPNELLLPPGATWRRIHQDPAENDQPSMSDLVWTRRDRVELDGWSSESGGAV